MRKTDYILKEVLKKIEPEKEDLKLIKSSAEKVIEVIKNNLKKRGIKAELFTGGSFAKKTLIKKNEYDIDIFIRYGKVYEDEELSPLTKKALGGIKFSSVHGSRDYFRITAKNNLIIEIIPVKKINKPEEYENVTDLSYFHVKYINNRIKSKKLIDEIKIAKAFCYANGCYGAESYISGFSGYSLELLVYYHKGFFNFVKAMAGIKKEKEIIDIEKHFKSKKNALIDLNSSKLGSPIILIDPTYNQRNALAALSWETFEKFRRTCAEFLKNPSIKFFEVKKVNIEKIKEDALKKGREFILIEARTDKPEGDIAGSKLLKFYNYLDKEISKFFIVKNKGFNYNEKKSARYFFVVLKKKEVLYPGPFINDKENCRKFRKEHKNIYEKKKRLYSKEKVNFDLKEFINKFKIKNAKIIKEMYIVDLNNI